MSFQRRVLQSQYLHCYCFPFKVIFISNEDKQMLKISGAVGAPQLHGHTPILFYRHEQTATDFTCGAEGEVVAWRRNSPLFTMYGTVHGDTGKVAAMVVLRMKQITEDTEGMRLVTAHADNRIRIWSLQHGICLNVSAHHLFNSTVVSLLAPPNIGTRFIFVLLHLSLHVLDTWSLQILATIDPRTDQFIRFINGSINSLNQAILYCNIGKKYTIQLKPLLSDHLVDIGLHLNNFQKATAQIKKAINQVKQGKCQTQYAQYMQNDTKAQLTKYTELTKKLQSNAFGSAILSNKAVNKYPQIVQLLNANELTKSLLCFLYAEQIYYLIGFKSGLVCALPYAMSLHHPFIIQFTTAQCFPVTYIRLLQGLLFIGRENASIEVYSSQTISDYIHDLQQEIIHQGSPQKIYTFNLSHLNVFSSKMSSCIKYHLHIHSQIKHNTIAFKLMRNEVLLFDCKEYRVEMLRGIPKSIKIYAVLLQEDYIGVCTSRGIEMYSQEGFQRTVMYQSWNWGQVLSVPTPYCYDYFAQRTTANSLIKFNSRLFLDAIDYQRDHLVGETFGKVDFNSIPTAQFPKIAIKAKSQLEQTLEAVKEPIAIIRLKVGYHSLWKNQIFVIQGHLHSQISSNKDQNSNYHCAFQSLFGWDSLDVSWLPSSFNRRNRERVLNVNRAMEGVGNSMTVYWDEEVKQSQLHFLIQSLGSLTMLQCNETTSTNSIVQAVEYYSKEGISKYQSGGGLTLSKLIVSQKECFLKLGFNLLMSYMLSEKMQLHPSIDYFILNLKVMEERQTNQLSFIQTVWMVYLGVGVMYLSSQTSPDHPRMLVNRMLSTIESNNFLRRPAYVTIVLKILVEGLTDWKHLLSPATVASLYVRLFRIYFHYEGMNTAPHQSKNDYLGQVSPSQQKQIKHSIIRTIKHFTKQFLQPFHAVLRQESVNVKVHLMYPATVIELLRQYIKSQKPQTHLVFYIQLLLQCLSPINPHLRKYVQKTALNTLHLMCFSYKSISFNQPSQKLSVFTPQNLYIYCLRTSTKWRTIPLKDLQTQQVTVEMSPKGTYIALLAHNLRVWRLSSGFWSGVLGAFSQEWAFESHSAISLTWEESEDLIRLTDKDGKVNIVKL